MTTDQIVAQAESRRRAFDDDGWNADEAFEAGFVSGAEWALREHSDVTRLVTAARAHRAGRCACQPLCEMCSCEPAYHGTCECLDASLAAALVAFKEVRSDR